MKTWIHFAAIVLSLVTTASYADGAFDFADPCIKQEKKFDSNAAAIRSRASDILATWDAASEPPGEFRGIYVEAIRAAAFKAWSSDSVNRAMLDEVKKANPALDESKFFIETIYPKFITAEKEAEFVRKLFEGDYKEKIRPAIVKEQQATESKLKEGKAELDSACKPDFVSQFLRATIGNAAIIIGSNWEAAQNEKGDIAKAYRATTGISLTDIEKYGIEGGDNSELRKIVNNSGLRDVVNALDPSKWRIDTPKVDIPIKIDPPPPIKIGDVCIPWC